MRKLSTIITVLLMIFFMFACDDPAKEIQREIDEELSFSPFSVKPSKVTGDVQVEWKGKGGSGTVEDKLVYASFDAQESVIQFTKQKFVPAKGSFIFSVYKSDFTPEREIVANVVNVGFSNEQDKKAWIFAKVISDSKCDSSDHSGCSDSDHTEGGCSNDDSSHDGGCDHDDTGSTDGTTHDSGGGCDHDDTGSTDGTTHDSGGGCDHDDTGSTDDSSHDSGGGCDHDDSGSDTGLDHDDTSHDTGSGGKPDDKGGKGKQCRVGQYVVVKMHDKGSPGTADGITWKWFESLNGFSIESEPHKLCKKTILSGNLVVHIATAKTITHEN